MKILNNTNTIPYALHNNKLLIMWNLNKTAQILHYTHSVESFCLSKLNFINAITEFDMHNYCRFSLQLCIFTQNQLGKFNFIL